MCTCIYVYVGELIIITYTESDSLIWIFTYPDIKLRNGGVRISEKFEFELSLPSTNTFILPAAVSKYFPVIVIDVPPLSPPLDGLTEFTTAR